MEKDEYRIEHAQVCVRCETITIEKNGGLRWQVCNDCGKELQETCEHWKKYGLYACASDKRMTFTERMSGHV